MSQVYWMKKLIDFCVKEGIYMSNHLNDFNAILIQLLAQKISFDDSIRSYEC